MVFHPMGDTKRGRERKGKDKREQLRRHEIDQSLQAEDEPPESETGEEIDLGE